MGRRWSLEEISILKEKYPDISYSLKDLSDMFKRSESSLKHKANKLEIIRNIEKGKFVECSECGKEIYRIPYDIKNKKNHYCSRQCLYKWNSKNLKGETAYNFKNSNIIKLCDICGEEFSTYLDSQKYCSIKCKSKSQMNRAMLTCTNCNKEFERTKSGIYWAKKRCFKTIFCSKKCQHEYMTGETHPNYIKDRELLKDQNKSIRGSKEMTDWRVKVYERDKYTCQICSKISKKDKVVILNAHHIERFTDNEDLRFDINNGITLCEDCHKLTYGKESDFEEKFHNIMLK